MDDQKKAKSQIAEQLKNAGSILITTKANPSVDEISSAIGLTHLLQAMKKHATAVISTDLPKAVGFLNPDENIEKTTDRMRDFVLSFDKEKADKFRYKLVDDQVKIFITPYKTVITKDDFNFDQGDFNIDVIVVLGAGKRDELDQAILSQGRILHEAEVMTINAGDAKPAIGSVNWVDKDASSIAEMLVSISEALGSDLLSKDSAQALLTGIIDKTEMFSSPATSPKVMTMAAQLMAAGAEQQLIMKQLKIEEPKPEVKKPAKTEAKKTEDDSKPSKESAKTDDGVNVDLSDHKPPTPAPTNASPSPTPNTTPAVMPPPPVVSAQTPPAQPPAEQPGQYLQGSGPSSAGQTSVNEAEAGKGGDKLYSHAQANSSEPHINVHPGLPTMKQPKSPAIQPVHPAPTLNTPPPSQPQPLVQPAPAATADVDSARQAVEQAIAGNPNPSSTPAPRQDMSSTTVNSQESDDIVIDHDGTIRSK